MQIFNQLGKFEFCVSIKPLLSDGKNRFQSKHWLDKRYSDSVPSKTTLNK